MSCVDQVRQQQNYVEQTVKIQIFDSALHRLSVAHQAQHLPRLIDRHHIVAVSSKRISDPSYPTAKIEHAAPPIDKPAHDAQLRFCRKTRVRLDRRPVRRYRLTHVTNATASTR